MLKKENRLLVFKPSEKGKTIDNSLFRIKVFSDNDEITKFGFVVSKKIDKRAVIRNETKRVLKKSIKDLLDKINSYYKVVIIAKQKLDFKQQDFTKRQLEQELKKLKVIK